MRVLSIEISNILSIENASLTFGDSGLILVEGWNYDTGRSNGAGKTAIFNCLSFALFDKLPRKITASEILRRGAKTGSVKCSVLCGEDIWTVQRSRPKGVQFFRNGVQCDISQSEFETKLRTTYDQFLLTIYVPQSNTGNTSRFLNCSDSDKKRFFLQLLDLERFSELKNIADDEVESIIASINTSNSKLETLKSKIDAYKESLIDVAKLSSERELILRSTDSVRSEIAILSNIIKPDLSKYSKIEDDIRAKLNNIEQAKVKRLFLSDKYKEISTSIHPFDPNSSCSECGSKLDSLERRTSHDELQDKLSKKLIEIKAQLDQCDEVIYKESSIKELSKKLREKKNQESSSYHDASIRLVELEAFLNNKQVVLDNIDHKVLKNTELLNKIEILTKAVAETHSEISNATSELELYNTISSIYSPIGAQAYILDSIVDSFNEVIQKYVDILSPNMTYTLNSYKENAKGDVVAKFAEILTKNGKEVSVGSLSGGEQKGLSLCVDFALLEILETQFGMSFNPIILDEPFDGLDATGRELVIELLEQIARNRQIYVIDHMGEAKTLFSQVIRVELRNEVSTLSCIS